MLEGVIILVMIDWACEVRRSEAGSSLVAVVVVARMVCTHRLPS